MHGVATLENDSDGVTEANPNRPWRRTFLAQLRTHGNATEAARCAGVSLQYAYRCRKRSKPFRDRWAKSLDTARRRKIDSAESRLKHLGVDGYDEPVYQGGELVGHKRRYSVDALKTLLRAESPRKYARKQDTAVAQSISITVDARQAFLRDPLVMERALALDEALSLSRTAHPVSGGTIDVTPDVPMQGGAAEQRCEIASSPATAEPPALRMHAPIEHQDEPQSVLRKSIIAPIDRSREAAEQHPEASPEPTVQSSQQGDWADEPWDD